MQQLHALTLETAAHRDARIALGWGWSWPNSYTATINPSPDQKRYHELPRSGALPELLRVQLITQIALSRISPLPNVY